MPALVAGIYVLISGATLKTWMAGTSPAMMRPYCTDLPSR